MRLTGDTIFVQGRKLYERSDRFYQDDRGRLFDYRGKGKLYELQYPFGRDRLPTWFWIRPQAEPVLSKAAESILDQAENPKRENERRGF